MSSARGTFEVKLTPVEAGDHLAAAGVAALAIAKTFEGGLAGTSVGEMLSAAGTVEGSAAYVALEKVDGTLDGGRGTFVLQHTGALSRGEPSLTIEVVPDSGTGELVGLSGSMTIEIVDGRHEYEFSYSLGS